jgi:hypothetical protein
MPTRRKNARKNPSTTLLVGGGVAALAVAVAAWWWFRGRSPDDRLLLEGGSKGKGKFSPEAMKNAIKVRPSLKALSGQGAASGSATGETTVPGPALVGVMPPTPPGASSYFYTPPTR